MKSTYCAKYWILLNILLISLLLCHIIASVAHVAAAATDDIAGVATDNGDAMEAAFAKPTDDHSLHFAADPIEDILPDYKKVKKSTNTDATLVQAMTANVGPDDVKLDNNVKLDYANDEIVILSDSSDAVIDAVTESLSVAFNDEQIHYGAAALETEQSSEIPLSRGISVEEESLNSLEHKEIDDNRNILPDITETPTVTRAVHDFVDLPQDVLEASRPVMEALLFDDNAQEDGIDRINDTKNSEEMQKDEQIIKINDSGGTASAVSDSNSNSDNIPGEQNTNKPTAAEFSTNGTVQQVQQTQQQQQQQQATETTNSLPTVVEEVPIPVFSEWAQKQMEAAEKQQQLEQDVVNTSTQKRNNNNSHTNGSNKLPPLKLRAKNYASPDCGAKIISSNADASNTGAVLSSSKDEYMLSPCTNRIWFVVELCEAIQAQKIDLANFELFSSSPRNFTVAVSNRFPTRDWSNVGRFIAEDARTVQSFDLHPHLFGKFVRVDIHSHYSKEHFCPVSLFRVFGTSEFEAFETENHPNDETMDDFEDEFVHEQAPVKTTENNLFKSASDAVLSIVKKAAEVLVKPASNNNSELAANYYYRPSECCSPVGGQFSCAQCNRALVERINVALSCKTKDLSELLRIQQLRASLLNTHTCTNIFGIATTTTTTSLPNSRHDAADSHSATQTTSMQQSYFLHLLPTHYVGALCYLLNGSHHHHINQHHSQQTTGQRDDGHDDAEMALNLTLDKKLLPIGGASFEHPTNVNHSQKKAIRTYDNDDSAKPAIAQLLEEQQQQIAGEQETTATVTSPTTTATTTEPRAGQREQLARPEVEVIATTTNGDGGGGGEGTTSENAIAMDEAEMLAAARDVNIFNLNDDDEALQRATPAAPDTQIEANIVQRPSYEGSGGDYQHATVASTEPQSATGATEDPSSWDSIDNLLSSTTAMPADVGVATATVGGSSGSQQTAGGGTAVTNGGGSGGGVGINMQQRIPNGGPHTESIFIRLSNRIKALERNMSLSGQYLEELSRRYKKQVEELQQTLTQQTLNVRTLEEQSRRHREREQQLSQHNLQLSNELEDLTLQVHACVVVIIFVGVFVFLTIMGGILFLRSMRRETRELLALQRGTSSTTAVATDKTKRTAKKNDVTMSATAQRKLNRRKSFEDFSDHQQSANNKSTNGEKFRRPSEEAMLILKECGGDSSVSVDDRAIKKRLTLKVGDSRLEDVRLPRQRKISVCYGNNNNKNMDIVSQMQSNCIKRKGEKHSWPNCDSNMVQTQQHLQQLESHTMEEYDRFSDTESLIYDSAHALKMNQHQNGHFSDANAVARSGKLRKNGLKRQISAPINRVKHTNDNKNSTGSDFDDSVILDDDDLDNFLPVADLAYNEFMPEGPSGYQIHDSNNAAASGSSKQSETEKTIAAVVAAAGKKATKRLSSPAFFKSPFSKSLRFKSTPTNATTTNSTTPSHQSTSWEWYRSKRTAKATSAAKQQLLHSNNGNSDKVDLQRLSPPAQFSRDSSSSLSEINFPTNSNENSFRILEEAILSSTATTTDATAAATTTTTTPHTNGNGNGNGVGRGGGGGGGSSSAGNSSIRSTSTASSSTKKKKNRSFNKLFKKVF